MVFRLPQKVRLEIRLRLQLNMPFAQKDKKFRGINANRAAKANLVIVLIPCFVSIVVLVVPKSPSAKHNASLAPRIYTATHSADLPAINVNLVGLLKLLALLCVVPVHQEPAEQTPQIHVKFVPLDELNF
mmetsp:Transcript_47440/g.93329  ORF Transcript_47440/g.93329 Transcript_47440/m.93329 type:complete len:130 (+) Transcript_47440:2965-3354(+)